MTNASNHALVLDIGGSHVTAALVDLEKRQVDQASLARRTVAQEAAAEVLIDHWAGAGLDAMAKTSTASVTHVGIAMPGPFDYATGVSHLTHKFAALNGQNVGEALSQRWTGTPLGGTPVRFANDAALWALGEWWGGVARGTRRMIGVTLGTGLGSGFIDRGKIVTAGDHVPPSGEIWWVPYVNGIAEDQVSGRALVRGYQSRAGKELDPAQIATLASSGDPTARTVFEVFGNHLAAVMLPWANAFGPDCLVVGGNIARAWDHFRGSLEAGLPGVSCRVTEQYENSGLLGGAALRE